MDGKAQFGVENGMDKGKRRTNDDFGEPKRQMRESKFSSCIDLTKTPKRIYLDTRSLIPYRKSARREALVGKEVLQSFISFMS